jgi:IS30 family transposase
VGRKILAFPGEPEHLWRCTSRRNLLPRCASPLHFDNDTAFAQHALLRTMRAMTTWFCDAYASWQKGGIENADGGFTTRLHDRRTKLRPLTLPLFV